MLISIAKASNMLAKGKHAYLVTTDGKVAIAPLGKEKLSMSSIDALNMMFAVVKPENAADTPDTICVELDRLVEDIQARPAELTAAQKRVAAYRAIRGEGS